MSSSKKDNVGNCPIDIDECAECPKKKFYEGVSKITDRFNSNISKKKPKSELRKIAVKLIWYLTIYAFIFVLVIPSLLGIWFSDVLWIKEFSTSVLPFNPETYSDLGVSFTASAIQDVLFYLTIGLAVLIYSARKPEEERLDQKIKYLFPKVDENPSLKDYFKSSITRIGCINEEVKVTVVYDNYSNSGDLIRESHDQHSRLKNLHNMDYFSNPDAEVGLESSISEDIKLDAYGGINEVKVFCLSESEFLENIHDGELPMLMSNRGVTVRTDFKIPPLGEALLDFRSWMFASVEDEFLYSVSRYTKILEITFVNNTDFPFSFVDEHSERFVLEPLGKHQVVRVGLEPMTTIKMVRSRIEVDTGDSARTEVESAIQEASK
ncbi:MAG: hypothetical protein ACRBB4_11485 [Neptuniibacter sp.]